MPVKAEGSKKSMFSWEPIGDGSYTAPRVEIPCTEVDRKATLESQTRWSLGEYIKYLLTTHRK